MYTVVYGVNISTRIKTTSMTPTPSSWRQNAFHSETSLFSFHFFSILSSSLSFIRFILISGTCLFFATGGLPDIPHYPIVIMAGTMIKIMTTNNSRNSGTKSFVPASSPIFRARFLRSSKASSTSVRKSSRRFFVPVFRFCSRMLLSFR